jgi:hypothetical protein
VPDAAINPKGMGEKKMQTIEIKEKATGRIVRVEGDMVSGMRACVTRNKALRASNMGGEWSLVMDFHLSPDEYEYAISVIEKRSKS